MRIGYFVKDSGETINDVRYFDNVTMFYDYPLDDHDKEEIVEDLSDLIWDQDDGWEWLDSGTEISLVIDGEYQGDFKVTVETTPVFSAEKVKKDDV